MHRRAALLGILAFGFAIRMAGLSAIRHNHDHAFPIAQAAMLIDRGIRPVEGQRTTIGLPASPMVSYALASAVFLLRHPWALHSLAGMLDVLGLALLARLLRTRAELDIIGFTVLLAAASPWRVYFARGTWLPAWFPLLVTAWLACLRPYLMDGQRLSRGRVLLGWVLAAGVSQVHPVGGLLLIPWALTVWLTFRSWRIHGIGFAMFTLLMLPALLGIWQHRAQAGELRHPEGFWPQTPVAFAHALRMVSGRHFAEVWASPLPSPLVFLANVNATALELMVTLGAFGAMAEGILRRRPERALLVIWWGFPAVVFSLPWPYPIHIHYLVPTIPAGSLLVAEGLRWCIPGTQRRWWLQGVGIGIAMLWTILIVRMDRNALQHPWTGNLEGLPLQASIRLAHGLSSWPAQDLQVQVLLPAGCAETTPVWIIGTVGHTLDIRCGFHPERLAFAHAEHPVIHVLAGPSGAPPILAPLGRSPTITLTLMDGSWLALYVIRPGEAQPSVRYELPTDIGWRLIGYTLREEAESLEVITFWSVDEVPKDPMRWSWHMQPFHHLLDPQGRQVENPSGFGVPGFLWREGDLYIDRTAMLFPKGKTLRLEIGLFDPNRGVRARFMRPDGTVDTLLLRAWAGYSSDEGAGER